MTATVSEIAASRRYALVGGPFGSDLVSKDYVDSGVPVIRGQNMSKGRWIGGDFAFVSNEKAASLAANTANAGDIVFTQRGTLGQVALVPERKYERYVISQSQMKVTVDRERADPLFLYYYFTSPNFQHYISTNTIQTGVPHINLGILRDAPVQIPDLKTQRKIAHILGTLDDKIELNRRMNQTLESIARALFKSWFVDFDPVRAKAEGRDTGLPNHIADLFPDRLVDSELGGLPEGWHVKAVSDVADVVRGRSYSSKDLSASGTALVTLKSFKRGGGYRSGGLKEYTGKYKPEQAIAPGEVVVACTDVTQAAEVIGKPAIVLSDTNYGTFVASLDTAIVRPNQLKVTSEFLYCLLLTGRYQSHAFSYTKGTTVLHLAKKAIPDYGFALPPDPLLSQFSVVAAPLFRRIDANWRASECAERTRDALLPRLVAGELAAVDHELIVGERLVREGT